MGTELQVFNFGDSKTRVVSINGEPWWVAMDVCEVLGTRTDNIHTILDADEFSKVDPCTIGVENNAPNGITVVSEPGLYSLILRSRKPFAKAFKRWVTHEVLPSIRKTGSFSIPKSYSEALALAASQALQLEEASKREQLLLEEREKMNPFIKKYKELAETQGLYTFSLAAKAIHNTLAENIGRNRLTAWLRAEGYIRNTEELEPYQQHIENGLLCIKLIGYINKYGKPSTKTQTFITQKGLDLFVRKLNGMTTEPLPPEVIQIDNIEIDIDELLRGAM